MPIEEDPERCTYEPLDERLDHLLCERFAATFDAHVERLGVFAEGIGLRSVSSSAECNSDGDRWLKFLATDGTTWYLGWDGNPEVAVSAIEQFSQMMAETIDF